MKQKPLAILLIIVGVFGLFLPIIPGIVLITLGLIKLGFKEEELKKLKQKVKKKLFGEEKNY